MVLFLENCCTNLTACHVTRTANRCAICNCEYCDMQAYVSHIESDQYVCTRCGKVFCYTWILAPPLKINMKIAFKMYRIKTHLKYIHRIRPT